MTSKQIRKETLSRSKGITKETNGEPDSREALIRSAIRIFALKGFDGATVKDVADDAQLNISLISYHFGGKEALYRICLESFGLQRLESAERILQTPNSQEEFKLRLRIFAESVIEIHQRDADSCAMIHRAMSTRDPVTAEVFEKVFMRIFDALKMFVSRAAEKGFIRSDLDLEVATGMMFGGLMHLLTTQNLMRHLGRRTFDDPNYAALAVNQWLLVNTEGFFPRAPLTSQEDQDPQTSRPEVQTPGRHARSTKPTQARTQERIQKRVRKRIQKKS